MTEPTFVVRRAGPADWDALRAIRLEALADSAEAYGSTFADANAFTDERWRTMAASGAFYLAELDGDVVGMASVGTNDDRPGTRWLYGMYVTPAVRGRGAADALVQAVVATAREMGQAELYLQVTATLARARAFYERMGFRPTGTTATMNRDPGVTLVTMVRP